MFDLFRLWCGAIVRTFRNRRGLMLENLALRQQLAVLNVNIRGRTGSARQTLLGRGTPILVPMERNTRSRFARNGGPLAPGWIQKVLGDAVQRAKTSRPLPP